MALSKFTVNTLRNVFVSKGLTSAQHTLCFTQRLSNSHIVTSQNARSLQTTMSNSLILQRTFARYLKTRPLYNPSTSLLFLTIKFSHHIL
jgi:hypothetical protein